MSHQAPGQPSEAFAREVRGALEDLYDFAALERHRFARVFGEAQALPGETGGQSLRRHILKSVEALNPGGQLTQHEPMSRAYDLVRLRYVEGLRLQEAAEELGISERQAYRDLREAVDGLVSVLWARYPDLRQVDAPSAPAGSDIVRGAERAQMTDIKELVAHARAAVERLALGRQIDLEMDLPTSPVVIAADDAMAKQVLVSITSQCIQHAEAGRFGLALSQEDTEIRVALTFSPAPGMAGAPIANAIITQLSQRLGWDTSDELTPGGLRAVQLHIPALARTLLVIDDDGGLARLIERYLTDLNIRLVIAGSGAEGIRLAQDILPDLVILDVMMPGMDGWEVLQRLRTHPQTSALSVIVCSIFDDQELAYSLGARLVLPKPISQVTFLEALRQVGAL